LIWRNSEGLAICCQPLPTKDRTGKHRVNGGYMTAQKKRVRGKRISIQGTHFLEESKRGGVSLGGKARETLKGEIDG